MKRQCLDRNKKFLFCIGCEKNCYIEAKDSMNSRFLVRGKCLGEDKGNWATGNLIRDSSDEDDFYCIVHPNKVSIEYQRLNNTDYSWVDPDTLGQYTGFKDKNGKLIFEGDILSNGDRKHDFIIVWDEGTFMTEQIQDCDNKHGFLMYSLLSYFEVIGNIHDNPELLEKERV